MAKATKVEKVKLTPVQRAVQSRERYLVRMEKKIRDIQRYADIEINEVRHRMATVRVLLDALKRGDLKP